MAGKLEDRVREIIVDQLGVNAEQVTLEASFIDDLGADSLINWLADALGDGYAVSKYHSAKGFRVIEVARA